MSLWGAEGLPPAAVRGGGPGARFPAAPLGPHSKASDHVGAGRGPASPPSTPAKGRTVRGKKRRVSSARRERAAETPLTAPHGPAPPRASQSPTSPAATPRRGSHCACAAADAPPSRAALPAGQLGALPGAVKQKGGEMGSGRSSRGGSAEPAPLPGPWGGIPGPAGAAGRVARASGTGEAAGATPRCGRSPRVGFPGRPPGGERGRRGAGGGRACWRAAMGRGRLGCPSGRAAARGGLLSPVWARNSQQEFWEQKVLLACAK